MHTVMIVEDEPIIRDAVAQELSKWNYQVECVTDFNQVMDDFIKVNKYPLKYLVAYLYLYYIQ